MFCVLQLISFVLGTPVMTPAQGAGVLSGFCLSQRLHPEIDLKSEFEMASQILKKTIARGSHDL